MLLSYAITLDLHELCDVQMLQRLTIRSADYGGCASYTQARHSSVDQLHMELADWVN